MTEEERMRIINEHYEQDKAQITKGEMKETCIIKVDR